VRGAPAPGPPPPPPPVPPPPCRRRRWRPTRPRTHRRGGEGGRRSGPVGKDVGYAQGALESPAPLSVTCVAVGGRPPPPKLGEARRCAATEATRPTTRQRRLRPRARSRAASAHSAAAGAPGPGAGRASGGRADGGRRGPVGGRAAASGRARVGRRLRRAAPRPGRAATAPPGPPTRQWPGHRRPDCCTAGAERVRQKASQGQPDTSRPDPNPNPNPRVAVRARAATHTHPCKTRRRRRRRYSVPEAAPHPKTAPSLCAPLTPRPPAPPPPPRPPPSHHAAAASAAAAAPRSCEWLPPSSCPPRARPGRSRTRIAARGRPGR